MSKPRINGLSPVENSFEDFDLLPADALVRLPVVCALLACSAPTIWRGVRSGRIPQPFRLTPGVTAWRVGDLRQALRDTQNHQAKLQGRLK